MSAQGWWWRGRCSTCSAAACPGYTSPVSILPLFVCVVFKFVTSKIRPILSVDILDFRKKLKHSKFLFADRYINPTVFEGHFFPYLKNYKIIANRHWFLMQPITDDCSRRVIRNKPLNASTRHSTGFVFIFTHSYFFFCSTNLIQFGGI